MIKWWAYTKRTHQGESIIRRPPRSVKKVHLPAALPSRAYGVEGRKKIEMKRNERTDELSKFAISSTVISSLRHRFWSQQVHIAAKVQDD